MITPQPAGPTPAPRIPPGGRREVGLVNHLALTALGAVSGAAPAHVFTTLARHRRLFRRWLPFGLGLMPGGRLPRADTELVILRVAHRCDSSYERHHHEAIARDVGLTTEEIARVTEGPDAPGWTPRQELLLRAVDELHTDRVLSDPVWQGLTQFLDEPDLIELCLLVGHYEMLAMTVNSLRVQPDAAPVRARGFGRPRTPDPAPTDRTVLGAIPRYPSGLADLGDGVHAWLQPNGDIGESNAGLVVGGGASVLVDTLWDLPLTRRMLTAMTPLTADAPIGTLVNTHADGDHCWGNQLVVGAQIVGSEATRTDLLAEDPRAVRAMIALGRPLRPLAGRRSLPPGVRQVGALASLTRTLSAYDFSGVRLTPPTRTFTGELALDVGGRRLELIEGGPAHTPGDTVVHVPDAGTVFAGDLLFVGVAPILWVGPVENWLAALDRIVALAPRVVVPGHGPVTDLDGVALMREYWLYVSAAVRSRVAVGVSPGRAATQIVHSADFARQPFASWIGHERLAVSAEIIARSDRGGLGRVGARERAVLALRMARLAATLAP